MTTEDKILKSLYDAKRSIEDAIDAASPEKMEEDATSKPDKSGKKVAVVVGHTETSPGAWAGRPISEHEYFWNRRVAEIMLDVAENHSWRMFLRDGRGISKTYDAVGEWGADIVVELHFNAASASATGSEMIYVTERSKTLAQAIQNSVVEKFGMRDRGVKTPWQGRGQTALTALPIPSVITEPFFGTNNEDASTFHGKETELAQTYVDAIVKFLNA